MTREEKVAYLQQKAGDLVAWYDNRHLPNGPVQLKPWAKIIDPGKYVATQITRIQARNGDPFNRIYVRAYQALDELKQYIEAHPGQ